MKNVAEILENELLREELIMNIEVLGKVKELLLLPNTEYMTTKRVADYYEVPVTAINMLVLRHRDEIEPDGMRKYSYKELQDLLNYNNLKELKISGQGANVFTKRAVLRIGMLLRDSEVAQEVRTQLLNIAVRTDKKEIETIVANERELKMAILEAKNESELLAAISRLDNFRLNTISELENTVEVLAEKKVFLDNPEVLKNIVRRVHHVLKNSIDYNMAFYYGEIYSLLKDKEGINLWARRGKKKSPLYTYINEEEWSIAIATATAVANKYSVDISNIIK